MRCRAVTVATAAACVASIAPSTAIPAAAAAAAFAARAAGSITSTACSGRSWSSSSAAAASSAASSVAVRLALAPPPAVSSTVTPIIMTIIMTIVTAVIFAPIVAAGVAAVRTRPTRPVAVTLTALASTSTVRCASFCHCSAAGGALSLAPSSLRISPRHAIRLLLCASHRHGFRIEGLALLVARRNAECCAHALGLSSFCGCHFMRACASTGTSTADGCRCARSSSLLQLLSQSSSLPLYLIRWNSPLLQRVFELGDFHFSLALLLMRQDVSVCHSSRCDRLSDTECRLHALLLNTAHVMTRLNQRSIGLNIT